MGLFEKAGRLLFSWQQPLEETKESAPPPVPGVNVLEKPSVEIEGDTYLTTIIPAPRDKSTGLDFVRPF